MKHKYIYTIYISNIRPVIVKTSVLDPDLVVMLVKVTKSTILKTEYVHC